MDEFCGIEERYLIGTGLCGEEAREMLLEVATELYKEYEGDWLTIFVEGEEDYELLPRDIARIRRALYKLRYEEMNGLMPKL